MRPTRDNEPPIQRTVLGLVLEVEFLLEGVAQLRGQIYRCA